MTIRTFEDHRCTMRWQSWVISSSSIMHQLSTVTVDTAVGLYQSSSKCDAQFDVWSSQEEHQKWTDLTTELTVTLMLSPTRPFNQAVKEDSRASSCCWIHTYMRRESDCHGGQYVSLRRPSMSTRWWRRREEKLFWTRLWHVSQDKTLLQLRVAAAELLGVRTCCIYLGLQRRSFTSLSKVIKRGKKK